MTAMRDDGALKTGPLRVAMSLLVAFFAALCAPPLAAQTPPALQWVRQLGGSGDDMAWDVAVDPAGNVIVAGSTTSALVPSAPGRLDAFVAKYTPAGTLLWVRQFGSAGDDLARGVATDAVGNIFIAGPTEGAFGVANAGFYDAFVAKYTPAGRLAWVRQLGTAGDDWVMGVATGQDGSVVIAGGTPGTLGEANAGTPDAFTFSGDRTRVQGAGWKPSYDVFAAKFTGAGSKVWVRQFGTPQGDGANAVAVDSTGNVIVTGSTFGSLAAPIVRPDLRGNDLFVAKLAADGRPLWARQLGSKGYDAGTAVATDANGGLVIGGDTSGTFAGDQRYGQGDAILVRYWSGGTLHWTQQWGTADYEGAWDVAVSESGSIFATGGDALAAERVPGTGDAFLERYWRNGPRAWSTHLGTPQLDWARGVAIDSTRHLVVAGTTAGKVDTANAGGYDVFVARYAAVP